MYELISFEVVGVAPLLMHSVKGADPLDPLSKLKKAITAKGKKKTDADMEELARLDFLSGLYIEKGRIVMPSENLEAVIRDGAKATRNGKDAQSGIMVDESAVLNYTGPKDPEKLFEDPSFVDTRGVRVQNSRVMRTRPRFNEWSLSFNVHYLPDIVNRKDVISWVRTAGQIKGLGDFRPRFGRFEVTRIDGAEE